MTDKYDAIVVGGGHNGLVCSALLAQSGKQVLLLEANEEVARSRIVTDFVRKSFDSVAGLFTGGIPVSDIVDAVTPRYSASSVTIIGSCGSS